MKNKTLITLGLLTTLALPLTVKAGTEMHGGDSVVCFQNLAQKQKVEAVLRQNKMAAQMGYIRQDPFTDIDMNAVTVETLDVFETRQSTSPGREFIEVINPVESVKERIKVLNTKIVSLASILETSLTGFYAPSKWLASTTGIVEIDDSHELINYTKSCIPVQIAVQTDTRVYYDGRLYAKLDEVNKTALILHELMYSWAKNHSSNSFNVRKYVGLLMLKEFESYDAKEIKKEMSVDFNYNFLSLLDCKTTTQLLDTELTIDYSIWDLNDSACKDDRVVNIQDVVFDLKSYEELSKKIGLKITKIYSGKQVDDEVWPGRYYTQTDVKNIAMLMVANGEQYKVAATTEFEVTTNILSLTVSRGKILNAFPRYASRIKILGQSFEVDDDIQLQYRHTPSGKKYLSNFRLSEKAAKLSSVSGFKKTKKCDAFADVTLNAQGLVENCN